jgi:NDP-sugar pyrophosphorylase family protein
MLPVAILAGGLATRLRPATDIIPKALIEIRGEPFISHQLRLLSARGIRRVVLCIGYLGGQIQEYVGDGGRFGIEVSYSEDGPKLMGTAGAIRPALPLLGEHFFVLYGDSYLPCDYGRVERAFHEAGKPALMTVYRNDGQWDQSNVELADGRIVKYSKTDRNPAMRHIDYGLAVLSRKVFDAVPENQQYDLAAVYGELVGREQLAAYEVDSRFYEIGSVDGIRELAAYLTK